MRRISTLDLCRTIASLSVVIYHFTVRFNPNYYFYHSVFNEGFKALELGVNFFFILSGFLILNSLEHTKTLKDFYIKRFSKIYPTYILCVVISFLVIGFLGLPGREVQLNEFFSNFIFLNDMKRISSVDGAYWSLIVEIKFYLISGIIYFHSKERFLRNFFIFATFGLVGFWGCKLMDYKSLAYFVNKIFLCKQISFFIIGTMSYFFVKGLRSRLDILWGGALVLLSVSILPWNYKQYLYIILCIALFIGCLKFRTIKIPRIFSTFALLSYPLYLLHQNIGVALIRRLQPAINSDILRISLVVFLLLIVSHFIYLFFEKKISLKLREKYIQTLVK